MARLTVHDLFREAEKLTDGADYDARMQAAATLTLAEVLNRIGQSGLDVNLANHGRDKLRIDITDIPFIHT